MKTGQAASTLPAICIDWSRRSVRITEDLQREAVGSIFQPTKLGKDLFIMTQSKYLAAIIGLAVALLLLSGPAACCR